MILSTNTSHQFRAVFLYLALIWVHVESSGAQVMVAPSTSLTPPSSWVDSETGHRVLRISSVPHTQGLPFNKPAFTSDGRDMIYASPKAVFDLNLATLQSRLLVHGDVRDVLVGTKTRSIYFRLITRETASDIRIMNLDTGEVRVIGQLPRGAVALSINSDETLIAGTAAPGGAAKDFISFEIKEQEKYHELDNANGEACAKGLTACRPTPPSVVWDHAMHDRFYAQVPQTIFTMNIATGRVQTILKGTDWLGDVQFSPTDPAIILFSHEGPPALVDRAWLMRADGSQKRLVHQRSDEREAELHEFWSADGKTIWLGVERPTRANAFLVGYDLASSRETYLHLARNEGSLHFSQAPDGSVFAGGGRDNKPDRTPNTKPAPAFGEEALETLVPAFSGSVPVAQPDDASSFRSEKLVNLSKNDYVKTDPNPRFSPDGRLVFFTSDMFGPRYVFAVEVNK